MLSGSVTQAAQSLNLSQPAVSKMLAELEHQLGFQLFLRSRGSALTVTPEADALFYEVERSFSGIAALKRSEEHTSELQSLMRISYDVFCLKKKNNNESH